MRHESSCERRVVAEGGPALAAGTENGQEGRAAFHGVESASVDRHPLHAPGRAAVAAAPPRNGLGQRVHPLAPLPDVDSRGVWRRLHRVLLQAFSWADEIDLSRAPLDRSSVAAKRRQRHWPEFAV
jgi:hypothetical protein